MLAALLARAFADDPFHVWLLPTRRHRRGPRLFRLLLRQALSRGVVRTTEEVSGVAIWRPPRPQPQLGPGPEPIGVGLGLLWLLARRRAQLPALYRHIESFHPEAPHWHLTLLATAPERQGRGVGSALLASTLARCDAEGSLAHLECSRESNLPFYERHGFRVVGRIEIPGGPVLWPMRRPPAG